MICLGIESTAHTFGAAVVASDKKVLSNEKASYVTETGGIIPSEAARHHLSNARKLIEKALSTARLDIKDIGLIAYSQSPGIGHCLRIGQAVAKSLALLYNKPIIGVNHCVAHLEIGRMLFKECIDPVLLYASGANTQIIAYDGGKYRIFGETLDIGIGNFLDSFARELGLGFPGGPKIAKLAEKSSELISLPYVVKGMDVSFGGLLTNLKQKIKKGIKAESLAFSAQETAFAMLLEVTERAMAHTGKTELLLGGGVACNSRLREMAEMMCKERNARLYVPKAEFLVDNAAMIAWLGILSFSSLDKREQQNALCESHIAKLNIRPYERTDDVVVKWR